MSRPIQGAAGALLHYAGGTALVRNRFKRGVRILMYHRFPSVSRFEAQCAHLKKHYHPVALADVSRWLQEGKTLPENAVAITVDDGYRDFLENAVPVLEKFAIPATLFLATDLPDRESWLWVDQVPHWFCSSPLRKIAVETPGRGNETWTLESDEQRRSAGAAVKEALKKCPNAERLEFLRALPELLEVDRADKAPKSHAPLQWADVRELVKRGVEFGAHTRSHPVLARVSDTAELQAEIAGSKQRIEQETGALVEHFCYPNGQPGDFNAEVVSMVKASGFQTAVTASQGVNFAGADPYGLRRIPVGPDWPDLLFYRRVAGYGLSA